MKLKKLLWTILALNSFTMLAFSCSKIQVQTNDFNQKLFDWVYNKEQLNYLIKNHLFFNQINFKENKIQVEKLKEQKNNLFLKKFNNDLEILYQNSEIKVEELKIFSSNNYLNSIKKEKFNNLSFFPNLQYALFDIFLNKDLFKLAIPNWINFSEIRFEAFLKNKEQQEYLAKVLSFYLKAFEIPHFSHVEIIFNNDKSVLISLKNEQNQDLFPNWKKFKFELPNFKDYNQRKTWNRNFDLNINDSEVLLNEKFNDLEFLFKNNPLLINSYESLIENSSILHKISAKGFLVLLKYLQRYINIHSVNLKTPLRVNLEKSFEIPLHLPLNNSGLIFPITLENESKKQYRWYSVDFSKHHHVLSGYFVNDNLNFENNFDYTLSNFDQYSDNKEMKIKSSLSLEDFAQANLQKIFDYFLYLNKDNEAIWNGVKMKEFDPYEFSDNLLRQNPLQWIVAQVAVILNSYLFDFENTQGFSPLDIQIKNIKTDPQNLGQIILSLDITNLKNNKILLNLKNLKIGGFRGFDYSDINKFKNKNSLNLSVYPQFYK
ncbi:Uncharacterised protein [Mycoplasmopsis citelli]|uniref:Lipoprotein n=1 Tax=Mycoplasmopsis citelli TaxID=171281 RepID=A0A449B1V4_9BACT|nr:hypothetical protein [Mycoplasmopsis citelli]VEU74553.1 Uncharacterised protein [Mycoplasmopsis citelli]